MRVCRLQVQTDQSDYYWNLDSDVLILYKGLQTGPSNRPVGGPTVFLKIIWKINVINSKDTYTYNCTL